ncbi:MAG: hypothetical protein RLZZ142_1927, partial [Verrucomicrobiota bacterium]
GKDAEGDLVMGERVGGLEDGSEGWGGGEGGEFPEAAGAASGVLFEQQGVVVEDPGGVFLKRDDLAARGFARDGLRVLGVAVGGDGAVVAAGLARGAEEGPKFHQGGVVGAPAGFGGEKPAGKLPEEVPALGGIDGVGEVREAGEDAGDVGVDGGGGKVECEGGDGSGGVGADSREGGEVFGVLGEAALEAFEDGLGGAVEVARAGVVAQALPEGEDVLLGGACEGFEGGKALHPAGEEGQDGGDLGLLEHELAHEDGVGGGVCAPGELASVGEEPRAELAANHLCLGRRRKIIAHGAGF